MVSGRRTLSEIERSIKELRAQEQQLLSEADDINTQHIKLLSQRTAAFRELAEVRMHNAIAADVIDEAYALDDRVRSLLKARQETISQLKTREAAAAAERKESNARAETLRNDIEALETKLDEAAEKAKAHLRQEATYNELVAAREQAKSVHQNAAAKAKQAEEDRLTKGSAYESDPLFMYLWKRKYGSSEYRPNWLVRMGDDWVAHLIGYREARANYTLLNEIPDRLAKHVELLSEELRRAVEAVEFAEAERIKRLAGVELIDQLADARTQQFENNTALDDLDAEIAEVSRQLVQYAEGLDASFEEAVALSASFLQQESYQRLIMQARRTAEPTDDRIVDRIGQLDLRAADLQRNLSLKRKDLDRVSRNRQELIEVAQKYRRNYYDDISSEFEVDDLAKELFDALIRGTISGADYWARSQRRHDWRRRSADPFRRHAGFPPMGGGSSGRKQRGTGGRFHTGGGF